MKTYEKPIAEIIYFDEDLITTEGGDPITPGGGGTTSGGEGWE